MVGGPARGRAGTQIRLRERWDLHSCSCKGTMTSGTAVAGGCRAGSGGSVGLHRPLVPAVALLAGDPEFGVRNVWVWVAGGVRCKRVAHRTTEAEAFFPDWFVWVFAATKRGDGETSGCEHSEPVSGSSGGSHPGAVPERVTLSVPESPQSWLSKWPLEPQTPRLEG